MIAVNKLSKSFRTRKGSLSAKESFRKYFFPQYEDHLAVNDISFEVKRGERAAFIGPNGAGKSTTIKIMTGIFHPSSGSVKVLNMDPYNERIQVAYRIGTVFGQRSQLWYHLPASHSFKLIATIYDIDNNQFKKRLGHLKETFQLESFIHRPIKELSLGERMRCELVASLLHHPDILFLDEPTIGLDLISKKTIRDLIYKRSVEEKTTIFLTSHDIADIEQVCNRIILINHGKIVIDANIDAIKKKYLSHKILSVSSTKSLEWEKKAGLNLKNQIQNRYHFEVDLNIMDAHAALLHILKSNSVTDINIQDPSLEELIRFIYQSPP